MRRCTYYAPGPGHYWKEESTGQLYVADSVESDGSFRVSRLNGDGSVTLNSATHGFSWVYQRCESAPVLVLLNQGRKTVLACFNDRADETPGIYDSDNRCPEFTGLKAPAGEWPVFCGLDSPGDFSVVRDALGSTGLKAWSLQKRPVLVKNPGGALPRWNIFAVMEGWLVHHRQSEGKHKPAVLALVDCLPGNAERASLILLSSGGCFRATSLSLCPEGDQFPGGLSVFSSGGAGWEEFFHQPENRDSGTDWNGLFSSGQLRLSLTGGDSSSISGAFFPEPDSSLAMKGLKSVALGGLI